LLQPGLFPHDVGWRLAFGIGACLGLVILALRRFLPESPRWLMTHGHVAEAERIVEQIERRFGVSGYETLPASIRIRHRHVRLRDVFSTLLRTYPRRSLYGFVLMTTQAFFYNAIFFSYALVLTRFYDVPSASIGWYVLPFALGNFIGPLVLGPLFDTLGRRPMIASTYAISGALLAAVGYLFRQDLVDAATLTACWSGIFFFASAAASSAYLTVSEIFPLEIRALAIAFFYAVGTGVGGVAAPWLLGALIDTGSRASVAAGYYLGAVLMVAAALVEWRWGVAAERRSLERVCRPLTFLD
jgi:MFS family permease